MCESALGLASSPSRHVESQLEGAEDFDHSDADYSIPKMTLMPGMQCGR